MSIIHTKGKYERNNGRNDRFLPHYYKIGDYHLYVFNRWGQLLYDTDKIYQGWDGTYQGQDCQMGVYVWFADYQTNDLGAGIWRRAKGSVTLIR